MNKTWSPSHHLFSRKDSSVTKIFNYRVPFAIFFLLVTFPLSGKSYAQTSPPPPPLPSFVHRDPQGFIVYDYVKHLQNAEVFIVQGQKTPDQQACRYLVPGPRIYPGDSGVSMQGIAEKPDTCQMRYERARTPYGGEHRYRTDNLYKHDILSQYDPRLSLLLLCACICRLRRLLRWECNLRQASTAMVGWIGTN